MLCRITVLPEKRNIEAAAGTCLLDILRQENLSLDAPCGGSGTCGKCKVTANGREVLACRTYVDADMTVILPAKSAAVVLTEGIAAELSAQSGLCLAVDIGTTTVAAYLTENGQLLATESRKNPQALYGADVVSRIQHAVKGGAPALTALIRSCIGEMTAALLAKTGKSRLNTVCVVGNPAMQQLFLGLSVENLTKIPFRPVLTEAETADGGAYIPQWEGAQMLTVPDIAGYIGADTVACILAAGMAQSEKLTLLVDIGTNGELVLGNKDRMVACATAAGPALEGAGIGCGMQAATGAIDRVSRDFTYHVIGGGKPAGICGSGLLDTVAAALEKGIINERGRILNEQHMLPLGEGISLNQEDIRQLQQAKGAIAAGIRLLTEALGVTLQQIEKVYLAGAFGTFMDRRSACRVGLIPAQLEEKIEPIGNAAGSGAMCMACSRELFQGSREIAAMTEHVALSALPGWAKCFARSMRFDTQAEYWCQKALGMGFSHATPVNPMRLTAREDVRAMCASDKCRAYGKNWTCPPHCGSPAECEGKMRSYASGILLQTVGKTRKTVDTKAYRETEQLHLRQFYALAEQVKAAYPEALCLGSGGCRICESCAWPEPCRFPEKACASMEGYGLLVADVCRESGLSYHHGEKTVTYTACILF